MIRIGIDGRAITRRMGGMGKYLIELMRSLDREMPDAAFFVYLRHKNVVDAPSSRWTFRADRFPGVRLPGPFWSRFRCSHLSREDHLDVFWAAAGIAPSHRGTVPVLTTVFDLNHLVCPTSMPVATRIGHQLWMEQSLRESERRVAISAGTAARVTAAFGLECQAIAIPGIGRQFMAENPQIARSDVPDYVLSVATREPRKNLGALLRAMAMINEPRNKPLELWLVGGSGWGRAFTREEQAVLGESWCHTLGYVPDAELPDLYSNARAFAFPSLYEGYGIPVAEARSQGTPIVATDIPELREAGGDDAIYTGTSAESIRAGIEHALAQPRSRFKQSFAAVDHWKASASIMADQLKLTATTSGHLRNKAL